MGAPVRAPRMQDVGWVERSETHHRLWRRDPLGQRIWHPVIGSKPAADGLFQVPAGEQFVAAHRKQSLAARLTQKGSEGGTQEVHAKGVAGNQLATLWPLKETILGLPVIFPEIASQETVQEKQHGIVPCFHVR